MKYIKNIILVLVSFLIILLFSQFIFHFNMLKIVDQRKLSRNILYNLDYYYHTFYPNTYNRKLKNYTAIIGDSYAMGQGDGWLKKKDKYSTLHYLNDLDAKNYINFGKPGGKSITSFREFFYRYNQIENSIFLPKIERPNKIIFFFYEGNDIIDNFEQFTKQNLENLTIKEFVEKEIENFEYYKRRKFDIYFPIINTSKKLLLEKFIHYVYLPYVRSKIKKQNGESNNKSTSWPTQPSWFKNASDIKNIYKGLAQNGMSETKIFKILGLNWLEFMKTHF